MEPKKSSEEIGKKVTNKEKEIWEEVKADDSEKTLEEDEDEWEEIEEEIEVEVEEEDEPDPEIEEDPEEETEDDNKKEEKDDIDPTSSSTPLSKNLFINQRRLTTEKRGTNSEEDNQKKNFNDKSSSGGRVWCQEDEMTILEGLIEYKNREGTYPPNDMVDFHEFIKWKLLSSDISRIQTYEKIKRLKRKFLINLEKVEDLVEPVFSKPHDYVLFHLSRKLWGEDCNNNTNSRIRRKRKREIVNVKKRIKKDKKSRKKHQQPNDNNSSFKEVKKEDVTIMEEEEEEEEGDFETKYPFLSEALSKESSCFDKLADGVKRVLKEKLSSIGSAKAKELEMEWKKLREQESVIFLQKMNLIALQTQLMSKEIKKP